MDGVAHTGAVTNVGVGTHGAPRRKPREFAGSPCEIAIDNHRAVKGAGPYNMIGIFFLLQSAAGIKDQRAVKEEHILIVKIHIFSQKLGRHIAGIHHRDLGVIL